MDRRVVVVWAVGSRGDAFSKQAEKVSDGRFNGNVCVLGLHVNVVRWSWKTSEADLSFFVSRHETISVTIPSFEQNLKPLNLFTPKVRKNSKACQKLSTHFPGVHLKIPQLPPKLSHTFPGRPPRSS